MSEPLPNIVSEDLEAAAPADKTALRLWLRLLSCATVIEKELSARLRKRFDVGLSRFDVLAQLDREPQGLSMSQLSSRVMATNGNVTALVKGLEADGLVKRVTSARDRRIAVVTLTEQGAARFRDMARVHEAWVSDLLSAVTPEQQDTLMDLLGRVKQSARHSIATKEETL